MSRKPAVSLAAMSGRRKATIELAQEIERRGFAGIYCPSFNDGMGLCEALALCTKTIRFGTGIANIYTRHPFDYAQSASLIHELSDGRFLFGIGVSHDPVHARLGIKTGKPLGDVRRFVEQVRTGGKRQGDLPPIVLATLRKPMVRLAAEIAEGAMWANAARSHIASSLAALPADQRNRDEFFIGNMIPICISDDRQAAAAVVRKVLTGYVTLPNYQSYWIEAGYQEEMHAIQRAIEANEVDRIPSLMSERWLSDVTLFGSVTTVRDGLEAWYGAGMTTPILVPSSTAGGQMQAFAELLKAFE
jgi:alkanesulfonate monooxygenase SsuD/methylene tetrahydromethanopterin reductase-like flavin-dependent oxidoreductase (luciferase family)